MEKIKYARDRKRFGKYIKDMRGSVPLRIAGKRLGIPFGMLACIERGEPTKITMDFLANAAKQYEVSYDDMCEQAQRIPQDIYFKVANNRQLWEVIRNYKA